MGEGGACVEEGVRAGGHVWTHVSERASAPESVRCDLVGVFTCISLISDMEHLFMYFLDTGALR